MNQFLYLLQLIELIVDAVPSRGNWFDDEAFGKTSLSQGSTLITSRLEAKNILIIIVLSTVSAFLAAVLISAILCMVRPLRKSRERFGDEATAHCSGSAGVAMKLPPFLLEAHNSTPFLIHPQAEVLSCSDSAALDGHSAVRDGNWIVGTTGSLISAYDGSELMSGTIQLQTDGVVGYCKAEDKPLSYFLSF